MNTKISVLMPSFNQGDFIASAIESCLSQEQVGELIIADGGSTDSSISKIKKISVKDSRVRFFSGKDNGPSDALNKALNISRFDFIAWLNADDLFKSESLRRATDLISKNKFKMVYGNGQYIDYNGNFLDFYPTHKPSLGIKGFQDGCFICQPTVVISKDLLIQIGCFNTDLKCCFDLDLWFKFSEKGKVVKILTFS